MIRRGVQHPRCLEGYCHHICLILPGLCNMTFMHVGMRACMCSTHMARSVTRSSAKSYGCDSLVTLTNHQDTSLYVKKIEFDTASILLPWVCRLSWSSVPHSMSRHTVLLEVLLVRRVPASRSAVVRSLCREVAHCGGRRRTIYQDE